MLFLNDLAAKIGIYPLISAIYRSKYGVLAEYLFYLGVPTDTTDSFRPKASESFGQGRAIHHSAIATVLWTWASLRASQRDAH